jgi:hypothetical protein
MADVLTTLEVGDEVLIGSYGRFTSYENVKKITRLTPKQIIVGNARYNRETGREVGGKGYLKRLTREKREELVKRATRQREMNRFTEETMKLTGRAGWVIDRSTPDEELAIWLEALDKVKALRAKNAESDK